MQGFRVVCVCARERVCFKAHTCDIKIVGSLTTGDSGLGGGAQANLAYSQRSHPVSLVGSTVLSTYRKV